MTSEFHIDYAPISHLYAKEQPIGTLYLAFRDVPQILDSYLLLNCKHPVKALDFGCGTGVSTRYLKSLAPLFRNGLEVQGVDISVDMLQRASEADSEGAYHQIQYDRLSAPSETFDLVFSSFVLFEFASLEKMQNSLKEIRRVMKKGGIFIAVTGSVETYNRLNQWVSLKVDFEENASLKSGELGRVDFMVSDDEVMTFHNYYWREQDYQQAFENAGLQLNETYYPLGYQKEEAALSWQWKSEMNVSPYYIFILQPFK